MGFSGKELPLMGLGYCALLFIGLPVYLGMYPVVGPGRALSLAMKGLKRPRPVALSQRTSEVTRLKGLLTSMKRGEFLLLTGEAGSGRRRILETALQTFPHGAILTLGDIATYTSEYDLTESCKRAILTEWFVVPTSSAGVRRVLWWHHFLLRTPLTLVLETAPVKAYDSRPSSASQKEGGRGEPVERVARAMSSLGARVILLPSPNRVTIAPYAQEGEVWMDVEGVGREELEGGGFPELAPLLAALRKEPGLGDLVWCVLGGSLRQYMALSKAWEYRERGDLKAVVTLFLEDALVGVESAGSAVRDGGSGSWTGRGGSRYEGSLASTWRVMGLLQEDGPEYKVGVPCSKLMDLRITRPYPDNLLRTVPAPPKGGAATPAAAATSAPHPSRQRFLVPINAATRLLLRLERKMEKGGRPIAIHPNLNRLKELLAEEEAPRAFCSTPPAHSDTSCREGRGAGGEGKADGGGGVSTTVFTGGEPMAAGEERS